MNKINTSPMELVLPLPRTVEPEVAADIEKESVYVSPYLERLLVEPDRNAVRAILKDPTRADEVADKATRYLEVMARQLSGFETKVFFKNQRRDDGPYAADASTKLVERGWLFDYGKGQVSYSGPVLKLAQLIDQKADELYGEELSVNDGFFPAMVDAEILHRAGYFDSHPNAVNFVARMIEDFDAIEEFRQANSCSQGALLPPQKHIVAKGMCLNPAACFPCYPTMLGKHLKAGECHSWLGRVFRYESRNICGLDRLREFNVRELVFVGDEAYARACREKALRIVAELTQFFDLDAMVQTATNPFFATVSAAKKFFQQSQEVKNEILIPVANEDGSKKYLAAIKWRAIAVSESPISWALSAARRTAPAGPAGAGGRSTTDGPSPRFPHSKSSS